MDQDGPGIKLEASFSRKDKRILTKWQARYKKLEADLFYLPQLFEVGVFLIPFQRKGDWDRARLGTMLRKTWFVRNRAVKGTQRI